MMRLPPFLEARILAIRRRLALAQTGTFDPYPPAPAGVSLSPSQAHFPAYESASLRLSWYQAGREDPALWQAEARLKLATLTGYRRAPDAPRAAHEAEFDVPGGFRRRRLYLAAGPGLDLPVNLVWCPGGPAPRAAMICLQGTNSGAQLSWGEVRMPSDPIKIANGGDYARQAAARNYLAVCLEQSCFGERMERVLSRGRGGPCASAGHHALLLGRTLVGERASDVSSVIDWLRAGGAGFGSEAMPIYVMGNSAGGTTAVFAGAIDERVDGVLAGGCVGWVRDTIARRPDAEGQNTIPGLLEWLEFDDVIALCAPRPFLAIAGRSDHIFPFAQAEAVVSSARTVYAALGAPDGVTAVPGPGGHRFYPEIAWDAFAALPGAGPPPGAGD